ncbi:MAG: hypothetical protein M1839_001732 [Geoglossum umbratile]|nr:MAG: hypothetical protein M1839_001732 [Geoglossum umbratile]
MSLKISTAPSEDEFTIRALLSVNLFNVFNERDESKRSATVQTAYADDIIWYESPDNIIQGRVALNDRASELQTKYPDFKFSTDGITSVSHNIGVLRWHYGPEDKPDLIGGTDVIIVEGGKIKALWTTLDSVPEK